MSRISPAIRLLRNLHMLGSVVDTVIEQRYLPAAAGDQLSFQQLNLLKMIATLQPARDRDAAWRIGDIARYLDISFPAASQTVHRLARQGWLELKRSADDQRSQHVSLTPKGSRAVAEYEKRQTECMLELIDGENVDQWNQTLETLLGRLLRTTTTESSSCLRCGMYSGSACLAEQNGRACPVRSVERKAQSAGGSAGD